MSLPLASAILPLLTSLFVEHASIVPPVTVMKSFKSLLIVALSILFLRAVMYVRDCDCSIQTMCVLFSPFHVVIPHKVSLRQLGYTTPSVYRRTFHVLLVRYRYLQCQLDIG
ncbi:hypothetical protein, unlikely [Trypanosoma brucei gambiense DAL972]|uniref:Uncharacterized protein n=1 Tax=Trypanosoma brucei gambiense (strain MHOM/CI/86/DAL972) TaxID=679716 RepID=C9ZWS0_TRYB9|nr:hypothetical protein, unlikely [Trypanosoma brucei gambiense DAL972]CBH13859.1 hypothetical protein, unlikely [Trypanosoma brucei gambiense DAL972]|eukprot:XP_011776135.1 hypothetical protein, unlikely [Trypanosoma brucei gambiense DAL972]